MKLYLSEATSIYFKTLPFVVLRGLVYLAFAFLACLYFGLLYLMSHVVGPRHQTAQLLIWIIGLAITFPIVRLVREYFLYMVKAGHVAVVAELVTKGSLPGGAGQIEYGKGVVQTHFKESSVLFVMDRLVAGVIAAINRMMGRVANFLGAVPGMEGMAKVAGTILFFSLTYIDEAILARNFQTSEETPWQSARSGLILYAQSWREILGTAVVLGLVALVSLPVFSVILILPALGLGHSFPSMSVVFIAAAVFFSFALKMTLVDPWALTCMIVTYLKSTEGKQPDPAWENKLEMVSKKFCEIKSKAVAELSSKSAAS